MKNSKRIQALALCLAILPCLGAQNASQPPAAAPAAAPAATPIAAPAVAPEPAPDPAQLALAQEVIKSMHADKMFDQISVQMQRMAAQSLKLNSPNLTEEQKASAEKVSNEVMALSIDAAKSLVDKMDVVYAQVYSTDELNAMKAFYTSAAGQSMLQKQPAIMRKMMPSITAMQRELAPKVQKIIADNRPPAPTPVAPAAAAPVPAPAAAPAAQPAKP
jgi:uncharacterized protein